jgi:hypothetical protein
MSIILKKKTAASIDNPSAWKVDIFVDSADGKLKTKDESATVAIVASESVVDAKILAATYTPPQFITTTLTHFEVSWAGSSSWPPYSRTSYSSVINPTVDTDYLMHINCYCSWGWVRWYAWIEYSTNNSTWYSMPYTQYSNTGDNQYITVPITFTAINWLYYRWFAWGSYAGWGASIDLIKIR